MTMNIDERIEGLRKLMRREHLVAFVVPSTDPHNGEYVPDHWKCREWISGFDGSAGTAVITLTGAALWTDSRYFIAAEEQLRGTEFRLMRERQAETPTIAEWISSQVFDRANEKVYNGLTEVGIDGMCSNTCYVEELISQLRHEGGMTLRTNFDPFRELWISDRAPVPEAPITIQPLELCGETAASKITRIRKSLREQHADGILISALDDIAWTLNLRGSDVHCTPVFVSYLLIESSAVKLFTSEKKVDSEVSAYLKANGVTLLPYNEIGKALEKYPEYNILIDDNEMSFSLTRRLKVKVIRGASPVARMKTIKNEAEIKGFRRAMLLDGVAMVKFLRWLKPAVQQGKETEMSIDRKLTDLRAQQEGFKDLSFDTIAAYNAHGAIVHYEATPETDAQLKPEGLLLLDSGAQFQFGTTDITRTIALGPVTEEMKRVYTLVLKGHLRLQNLTFPNGASGTQLDAIAREAMWREGMNFGHGTGHGVGSYLSVHEGAHQIRQEWKPARLVAGMTVTDEPGLYLEGRFGVRIENTLVIEPYLETEFGKFLKFSPLTLCPIDTEPILMELLNDEERSCLNAYHATVREELLPLLTDADDRQWLIDATKEI